GTRTRLFSAMPSSRGKLALTAFHLDGRRDRRFGVQVVPVEPLPHALHSPDGRQLIVAGRSLAEPTTLELHVLRVKDGRPVGGPLRLPGVLSPSPCPDDLAAP